MTQSSMEGEALALMKGYGQEFLKKHDIEAVPVRHILLINSPDSKQDFDSISRAKELTKS